MAETLTAPFLSTSALDKTKLPYFPPHRSAPHSARSDSESGRARSELHSRRLMLSRDHVPRHTESPQQFRAALNGPQLRAAQWHHFEPHSYARGLMRDERGDESLGTCRAPFLHHHLHQLPPGLGTPSRAQPAVKQASGEAAVDLPWALQLHTCTRCLRACASPRACVARVRAIVGGHPL